MKARYGDWFMVILIICALCIIIPAFYGFHARNGHSPQTLILTTLISIILFVGIFAITQPKQMLPVIGAGLIAVALAITSVAMSPRSKDTDESKMVKNNIKNAIQIAQPTIVVCAAIANYYLFK